MKKLTLNLETITPLFMAGAEPEKGGELRPASFRGAMRYWLRALLGAIDSIDEVRKIEARIFGAPDEKIGAAKVSINFMGDISFEKQIQSRGSRDKPSGHDYLYYSMKKMGEGRTNRLYAEPGQSFSLRLLERPGAEISDQDYRLACASLWLLITLGGLGARSRRTAGSLGVKNIDGNLGYFPLYALKTNSSSELSSSIREGLIDIYKLVGHAPLATRNFDVLHPSVCKIWVISASESGWNTWSDAVENIGSAMRTFRLRRKPDYQNIRNVLENDSRTAEIQRLVFGLPLQFRFSSIPRDRNSVQIKGQKIERRASPLHLKITRLNNGKFVGVAVLFKSEFLPLGTMLKANSAVVPIPKDYSLIEEFITTRFSNQWEVTGW